MIAAAFAFAAALSVAAPPGTLPALDALHRAADTAPADKRADLLRALLAEQGRLLGRAPPRVADTLYALMALERQRGRAKEAVDLRARWWRSPPAWWAAWQLSGDWR